jgi:hypothetical protein
MYLAEEIATIRSKPWRRLWTPLPPPRPQLREKFLPPNAWQSYDASRYLTHPGAVRLTQGITLEELQSALASLFTALQANDAAEAMKFDYNLVVNAYHVRPLFFIYCIF